MKKSFFMNENKSTKYQLFELAVPATAQPGQRIYIGDQPQLRSQSGQMVIIESIETFSVNALARSPFSVLTTALIADLQNAILVLNVGGFEDLQGVPLVLLNRIQTNLIANVFCQDLFTTDNLYRVDWTKSYIQLNAAPSGAIAYLFGVRYKTALGNV
jgi:hypothetical protein